MKILVVQTGFLGDVILSTPVIRQLKLFYPQATISMLTTKEAAELVRYHPDLEETLTFDKRGAQAGIGGLLEMAQMLRKQRFDIVFSLHKSFRTAVLLWLSRIPVRYGFSEASARWCYTKTVPRHTLSHEVLRNVAILRNIGREPDAAAASLHIEIPPEIRRQAAELLVSASGRSILGVAPGSVWATKRWTVEGFSEVAKTFTAESYSVVLIGGEKDRALASEIALATGGNSLNLCGQVSILVSAAVIEQAAVLLSNDTAPLHLASAVGTPVVALYCATVPEFGFTPWKVPAICLGVEGLSCRPCGRHGGMTCPTGTHACQRDIRAADVIQSVRQLANEGRLTTAARRTNQALTGL